MYTYIVGFYKRNEGKGPRTRRIVSLMGTTLAEHGRTVIGVDGDGRVGDTDPMSMTTAAMIWRSQM